MYQLYNIVVVINGIGLVLSCQIQDDLSLLLYLITGTSSALDVKRQDLNDFVQKEWSLYS